MNVRLECEGLRLYVTQGWHVPGTSQSTSELVCAQHKQFYDYGLCACKINPRLHFIIGNMPKRIQSVSVI
jgi:hypothetical protein